MSKYEGEILSIIESSFDHPTAEQLFFKMKSAGSKVSLATVYNNLNSLIGQGKIVKIPVPDSADRYDKIRRHDHLICTKCKKVSDFFLKDLTPFLEDGTGIKIDSYDLRMFYICNECRKKGTAL